MLGVSAVSDTPEQQGYDDPYSPFNAEQLEHVTGIMTTFGTKVNQIGISEMSTVSGVSEWHICNLELQTRYHDWQNGYLNGSYFVSCLEDALKRLVEYLGTLAPVGWQCAYNRDNAAYYYISDTTGEVTWNYPSVSESYRAPRVGFHCSALSSVCCVCLI